MWYRPRFALCRASAAPARFGGFITIDRLLWYVYSQADALIIGKLLGKEILGLYSVGMHLASLPMQKLAGMLNEIGFSAFTRLQEDRAGLREHFIKAVRLLSLLSFPVFFGISSVAPGDRRHLPRQKWVAGRAADPGAEPGRSAASVNTDAARARSTPSDARK